MGLGPSSTTAKHEVTLLNSCRRAILAVDRPTQAEIQAGFRLRIESEPKILGVFVCSRLGFGIKTENDRWLTVISCCFCVNVHLYINGWYISISSILLLAYICWPICIYIYMYIFEARYSGISQQLGRAGWPTSAVRLRLSFKWIGQLATRREWWKRKVKFENSISLCENENFAEKRLREGIKFSQLILKNIIGWNRCIWKWNYEIEESHFWSLFQKNVCSFNNLSA